MEICGAVDLGEGVYWIGICDYINELHCNPYLIVDGDEGVLIDPGSVLDFEHVVENVQEIIPLSAIKYIILHHQDPDLCSSAPLFEKLGYRIPIVTHWRTSLMVKYYGINTDFYIVNENDNRLILSSGRTFDFIHTPYLHFPGAIATYDRKTKTLFSADLFGAIAGHWELFANENYIDVMRNFHEHYVPGNEVIRPVMELFLGMDIQRICPQHGSIIEENISDYITELRDLECGIFMQPIKKQLSDSGGYTGVCNLVLKRLIATYSKDEVLKVFSGSDIVLDEETGLIKDFTQSGLELWNELFAVIYSDGGIRWLTVIEPLVQKIGKEYSIDTPNIYSAAVVDVEKQAEALRQQNKLLEAVNLKLKDTINITNKALTRDPLTDLYNETFFEEYFVNLMGEQKHRDYSLLFIGVDNMNGINRTYGEDKGDEVIKSTAYVLLNEKKENHYIFKLGGPQFAYLILQVEDDDAVKTADELRRLTTEADLFVEPVTISIGVVSIPDSVRSTVNPADLYKLVYSQGKHALETARREGGDRVSTDINVRDQIDKLGRVLILDYDEFHAEMLQEAFSRVSIDTEICTNGGDAVDVMNEFHPDLVISEMHLPQADIFQVRQHMLADSRLKDIPIILVSHQKDENSVVRALNADITHYLKKPYLMAELLGIADAVIRKRTEYGT